MISAVRPTFLPKKTWKNFSDMGNILGFGNAEVRRKIAEEKADSGEFLQALGHLYSALKNAPDDADIIVDIADAYADMGLLELSNAFWFRYLDIAPKEKRSIAYEELAINFFYMDNVWAAGYYFHLKVAEDGFIAEEGLDEEILEFFSESSKRAGYKLVYPFERADYSDVVKAAKRSLSCGDYKTAAYLYRSLPEMKCTEEIYGDYAVSLFLADRDKEVIEVCKKSLDKFGPNMTAYCNLSTLFKAKGEDEKSAVYYAMAKDAAKGDGGEKYKLATCAIEQEDDETVKACLNEILKERPFDDTMNFFCGIAHINSGNYDAGCRYLSAARRIDPENLCYKFYYEYCTELLRTGVDAENYLPLKYFKRIPEKADRKIRKAVKKLVGRPVPKNGFDRETAENLVLGLYCGGEELAKDCAFLISFYGGERERNALFKFILDPEADEEIKKNAVYNVVNAGVRKKFGVTAGNFYVRVKLGKLLSREVSGYEFFTCGYAIATVRAIFSGADDFNKINFATNKLFALYGAEMKEDGFLPEEAATLITLTFKPEQMSVADICRIYGVKIERVSEYFKRYSEHKGGINDKDN